VCVVDLEGRTRTLSSEWETLRGLAWSASGDEVWFTAAPSGGIRSLHAVGEDGSVRTVMRALGTLNLQDISTRSEVLVVSGEERLGIRCLAPGATEERDLSWLDWSLVRDISPDGKRIVFDESGEGGGLEKAVYVRPTDGSPAMRLGSGIAMGFSPDGQWVLSILQNPRRAILLLPMGPGEAREVPVGDLEVHMARFLPSGGGLVLAANEPGQGIRLHRLDLATGKREAFTEQGVGTFEFWVSPDGRLVAAPRPDNLYCLFPIEGGGEPQPVPGMQPLDRPAGWSGDGRSLFVYKRGVLPTRIDRLDLTTGKRELWKVITPADSTGVWSAGPFRMTPDASAYAYTYGVKLSDLYLIRGLGT